MSITVEELPPMDELRRTILNVEEKKHIYI